MRLLSILAITMLLLTACSKKQDVKITETNSDHSYKFVADYNREETVQMQQYMNRTLNPNRIFVDHEDDIDKEIKLADGTVFNLKSMPGALSIHIDGRKNSAEAVGRIKNMCEGIKKIVGGE